MFIDDTYHGQRPDWRSTGVTRKGALFGVELEVYHPRSREVAADSLDNLKLGKYPAPVAERDGSIDRHRGVEIICPPLPRQEVVDDDGYIARLMQALRDAGTEPDPLAGYGLHINVNVVDWDVKHKLLVQFLLNKFARFGTAVGRRLNGFGQYLPTFHYNRTPGGSLNLVTFPGGKHSAAWIRGAPGVNPGTGAGLVMEVRFPKSTLNIQHIREALDYIEAVRAWVAAAPNHTEACCFLHNWRHEQYSEPLAGVFLHWCQTHRPQIAELISNVGVLPIKGKRLTTMQELVADPASVSDHDPARGFSYARLSNDGVKKQAIRISKIIGKGSGLQGEQDGQGRIVASSIKAAD